jgi:hypothetical protein
MLSIVHKCKGKSYNTCANEFAKMHNYIIIETIDDGNCFFDTLSKAGFKYSIPQLSYSHQDLRAQLVEYAINHIDEFAAFFVTNKSNSNSNSSQHSNANQMDIFSRIAALGENGVWNNNDGDLISQIASYAFRVNIDLFDVKKLNRSFSINLIRLEPNGPEAPSISILRINDGHYELLVKESYNSTSKKNRSLKSNHNSNHNSTTVKNKSVVNNSLLNKFRNMSVSNQKSNLNSTVTIKQGAHSYTMKMRHAGLVDLKVPELKRYIELELGQPIPTGIKTKQQLLSHLNSQK